MKKVHNKTKRRKAVLTEDGFVVLKPDAKAEFNKVLNEDALIKAGVSVSGTDSEEKKQPVKAAVKAPVVTEKSTLTLKRKQD